MDDDDGEQQEVEGFRREGGLGHRSPRGREVGGWWRETIVPPPPSFLSDTIIPPHCEL